MSPDLTARIAQDLTGYATPAKPIEILWHCGEPLACGLVHFKRLIAPFRELELQGAVYHSIQTNATLINEDWCEFFLEHKFSVGVSLDGPEWATRRRVNWAGREAFPKIMAGIETLKQAGIDFGIIAVVSREHLGRAGELYQFFAELGCSSLSVNLEEEIGINRQVEVGQAEEVRQFWTELFMTWQTRPVIFIREIHHYLTWLSSKASEAGIKLIGPPKVALVPTVGWQGDVVVLSPEFLGVKSEPYHDFVVGNLFSESLLSIAEKAKEANYVQDFILGKIACRTNCAYYSFCRGGYASNKYFEHGSTGATQTAFCTNSRQILADTIGSLIYDLPVPV